MYWSLISALRIYTQVGLNTLWSNKIEQFISIFDVYVHNFKVSYFFLILVENLFEINLCFIFILNVCF